MNPEQISRLLDLLEQIAKKDQTYTITGAADWPILAFGFGFLVVLIAALWGSVLAAIKTNKGDTERDIDNLWSGMRDCKNDCCEPLRNRTRD